jgi:pilus assembly protein Flp/PilA
MTMIRTLAAKFVREEEGASLAEYGLLLALIAIICIGGMTILGKNINSLFTAISTTV